MGTDRDDDASSSSERSLTIAYAKETYTYYTSLAPSASGEDVINVPAVAGTTSVGRNLTTDDGKDSTGLMIWPATHLLCQYLAYSVIAAPLSEEVRRYSVLADKRPILAAAANAAQDDGGEATPPPPPLPPRPRPRPPSRTANPRFPPLGKRILELGCGAGLCGIVASLALSRKAREVNAEFCKAAVMVDFDKIDLADLDGLSEEEEEECGDGYDGEDSTGLGYEVRVNYQGGVDEGSLESTGRTFGKKSRNDEDDDEGGETVIVCTDGDPEAVELCRENILANEYGDALFDNESDHGSNRNVGGGGGDDNEDEGDSLDEETAAAIAAAAGHPGGAAAVISPARMRQSSAYAMSRWVDGGPKRAFGGGGGGGNNGIGRGYMGGDEEEEDDDDSFAFRYARCDASNVRVLARPLRWGDLRRARDIMREATAVTSNLFSATDLDEDFRSSMVVMASPRPRDERFDTVMAADVVYPTTNDALLRELFRTVDQCLRVDGTFLLSFAARDGHRTALRLLEAASDAGFKIDYIPEEEFVPRDEDGKSMLPPTLDAKLLILRRDEDAADSNVLLGSESCRIFPGLRSKAERAANESEEEWDAPGEGDNEED